MVTTTWIAGSGDWNTASNWSNGVPTAADAAVFAYGSNSYGSFTVTGGGVAASLTIASDPVAIEPFFAGTLTVGTFTDDAVNAHLLGSAALNFVSGTISAGTQFEVQAGATLGTGPLTLDNGTLTGTLGALANPLSLVASGAIAATGTLAGRITGMGALHLAGDVVLANPGNTYSGGTVIGVESPTNLTFGTAYDQVELAATGAAGTGPLALGSGTLTLDRGVTIASITVGFGYRSEIDATDQATTVFAGQMPLTYNNGAGHATIVGAIQPGPEYTGEGPDIFGSMTVQGGTGSVTVFGGNSSGVFYGGTAGDNVLIGGADLSAYPPVENGGFLQGPNLLAYSPAPVTMFGGGDNDILVASGTDNSFPSSPDNANVLVAAGGSETLTGSGSTGQNVFYGGSGADVIAAGGGASTIVAGSGAATISGGSGTAAIFAGAGQDVVLGGTGADYVQAGAGNATLFAGAGMDLIGVVNGQAGGSLVVAGFRPATDRVSAQGYASAPTVTAAGGSTVLTFSDHTRVTLLGVASLPGSAFS